MWDFEAEASLCPQVELAGCEAHVDMVFYFPACTKWKLANLTPVQVTVLRVPDQEIETITSRGNRK